MLKAACVALYSPTSSEQERREANQWLTSFVATQAAWEAARTLLTEPAEDLQYFGANMLYIKVRSEWHGLDEPTKQSIYGVLRGLVQQLAVPPPAGTPWVRLTSAGKRLCLVLALAAVRSNALEAFTTEALGMAAAGDAGAPVALELLTALPQELLERNNNTSAKPAGGAGGPAALERQPSDLESRPELRALLPQVVNLLVAVLAKGGALDSKASGECAACCLRCMQHWLSLQARAPRQSVPPRLFFSRCALLTCSLFPRRWDAR